MDGRRMDMSATQVVASMLAAVTGAVAASDLGVAGTVIGAAVMSVASTVVAAVYKHYLGRSRERLRAAAEAARVSPLAGGSAAAAFLGRQRATEEGRHAAQVTGERQAAGQRRAPGADAERTEVLPAVGFTQHSWPDADQANGFADRVRGRDDEATRTVGTRYGGPGENGVGARDNHGQRRKPRPLLLAGIALAAFLLAMGGITIFEVASGKPLDALVWGKHGSGTTVQNVVSGPGGQPASRTTHPAASPSRPAPSGPPAPTSRASAPASPSPAPTPTTPSPTPTPTAGSKPPGAAAPQSPGLGAG